MGAGKTKYIDTTIIALRQLTPDLLVIECSPTPRFYEYWQCMTLSRSHPDYINLYQKLDINKTIRIAYKSNSYGRIIKQIEEPLVYYHTGLIKALLEIGKEFSLLKNYREAIMMVPKRRLLIKSKDAELIKINKNYKIWYCKAFGENLYLIIKYELSESEKEYTEFIP